MQTLKESEIRYRRLFETAQDGILILDAETGAIEDLNPCLMIMLGETREALIEKKLWQVQAFQPIAANEQGFAALQGKDYMRHENLPVTTKDGRALRVEFTSNSYMAGTKKVIQCHIRDVTEHQRMEDVLRESEERYRLLVEQASDGIFISDIAGSYIEVNPSGCAMLGYTREELLQKNIIDLIPIEDQQKNPPKLAELIAGKTVMSERCLIHKDGHVVDVEISSKMLSDNRLQGIVRDITVRKQAEKKLQESERLFYSIFHASPAAIVLSRLSDGRFVEINENFSKLTGYTPDEVIGMTSTEAGITVDPKVRAERLALLQQNHQLPNFEVEIVQKSGERRVGLTNVGIVSLNSEDFAVSTFIDITERRQAEADLRNGREFLQSVQDALSAHIAILDQEGRIVQVNAAWRNFAIQNGLASPDFCIGMNYLEICDIAANIDVDDAAQVAGAIRSVLHGDQHETWIEYPCHSSEQQRWFIARITSFENNSHRWIVVSHENITERKQGEERIRRQVQHLTALSAIDRAIASCFDLKLNLLEILMHVTSELGVDAADIFILNAYMMLEFGAENGFRTRGVRKAQMSLGNHSAGRAVINRRLVHIPNIPDQPAPFTPEPHWAGEDFVCYYVVPLIVKGQVKGVLEVFHRTPLNPDGEWLDFLYTLASQTAIAIENATLFSSLQRSNAELVMAYDATIEGWSRALDLRDRETEGHSLRVTQMTLQLAQSMGLSDEQLAQMRWGALLHDIGKMGIPDGILLKSGPLTENEWITMKKHPSLAYEMLFPIQYLRQALDIPYCHHEKWDGTGYPRGLKGKQIPLAARLFAVVDVWDALKSKRPYRGSWTDDKIREHIRASSGTHFDPEIVEEFMKIFR